jgi:hypothetical protein
MTNPVQIPTLLNHTNKGFSTRGIVAVAIYSTLSIGRRSVVNEGKGWQMSEIGLFAELFLALCHHPIDPLTTNRAAMLNKVQ